MNLATKSNFINPYLASIESPMLWSWFVLITNDCSSCGNNRETSTLSVHQHSPNLNNDYHHSKDLRKRGLYNSVAWVISCPAASLRYSGASCTVSWIRSYNIPTQSPSKSNPIDLTVTTARGLGHQLSTPLPWLLNIYIKNIHKLLQRSSLPWKQLLTNGCQLDRQLTVIN